METLNFKYVETEFNGGNHWSANNFKVVHYPNADKPFYASYYAVKKFKNGSYQFGNSCFHDSRNESMRYATKEEAFKACEDYLNSDKKAYDYAE